MASSNYESMLLGLTLELLNEITNSLAEDALLALRLTCKALESAVKDRFAQSFLAHRHFCVYDETRWDLLRKLLSSRLADRLHVICFTSEVLENKQCKQIELAPEEWRYDLSSAQHAAFRALHYDMHGSGNPRLRARQQEMRGFANTRPNAALIRRALLDLQTFAPNARVELHFRQPIKLPDTDPESDCEDSGRFLDDTVRRDVIFAAVTTGLRLDGLMLDKSFQVPFSQLDQYFKGELVACLSSVRFFSYQQKSWDIEKWQTKEDYFNSVREAIGSLNGKRLQTLWLKDVRPIAYRRIRGPMSAHLLRTTRFTHLVELRLEEFLCHENELLKTLSRCTSTLEYLTLLRVHTSSLISRGSRPFNTYAR